MTPLDFLKPFGDETQSKTKLKKDPPYLPISWSLWHSEKSKFLVNDYVTFIKLLKDIFQELNITNAYSNNTFRCHFSFNEYDIVYFRVNIFTLRDDECDTNGKFLIEFQRRDGCALEFWKMFRNVEFHLPPPKLPFPLDLYPCEPTHYFTHGKPRDIIQGIIQELNSLNVYIYEYNSRKFKLKCKQMGKDLDFRVRIFSLCEGEQNQEKKFLVEFQIRSGDRFIFYRIWNTLKNAVNNNKLKIN